LNVGSSALTLGEQEEDEDLVVNRLFSGQESLEFLRSAVTIEDSN
jgi:hypothetical protein